MLQADPRPAPRICACVLMNHPFPANLPLLRRIYRDRFSEVRFLIPFERMPDEPDVITVYRGSYTHATYLTDAQDRLSAIDCDYYLVIQDDVLLNPVIDEGNFRETFAIGPDDGFIAWIDRTQEQIGRCVWHYGFVPKLLYPKSQLFGSGIEPETLARYLPEPEALGRAIAAGGIASTSATRLDPGAIGPETFGHPPSRVLFHGLSGTLDDAGPAQQAVEGHSTRAAQMLMQAMLAAQRTGPGGSLGGEDEMVRLPIPTVTGNYFTDFYILPKSGFGDFCHYIGVAGAANLFVEIMAPTLLHAVCERVWTADALGIDFSGFVEGRNLRWFRDPRHVAIHPFKLSSFRRPGDADALVEALDAVAGGDDLPAGSPLAHAAFGRWPGGFVGTGEGWHEGEDWGVWAAAGQAVIPVPLPAPAPLRLILRQPAFGSAPDMTGRLILADGGEIPFRSNPDSSDIVVDTAMVTPDADGTTRLRLVSDMLVRPGDILPGSVDDRSLGFGLVRVERRAG